MPDVVRLSPVPLDELDQEATFDVVHISDESLLTSHVLIAQNGSMLLTCNSDAGVMGVSDVDIVLRDNGSASPNEGAALRKSQTKVCSSIESSGPRCEVLF